MSEVDMIARWLEVYPRVAAALDGSTVLYPDELRIGWRFIPEAITYAQAAVGDAANIVTNDYEVTARRFVDAVFKHEADPALDVAADLLLRHYSSHAASYNVQHLAVYVLRDRSVFDEPTPGWFWGIALFALDAEHLLRHVTYVPGSHFQALTQAFTAWFEPGPAVSTTRARKEWFDNARVLRDDEWATFTSGQFWALFDV